MTVSSTTDRKLYTGDDATVAFATSPVVFFDETDLEVYIITTATGVSVQQTLTTDYTVSGGAGSTGTVTMLTAPASTEKLLIKRVVPATQPSDFVNNDASDAEVVEDALDRLTMIAQQKNADSDYPIRLSDAETPTDALTVLPFDRASKVLAFNSSKELIATESEEAAALSAALAESGGSSLIGFVQSGTAESENLQSRGRWWQLITDHMTDAARASLRAGTTVNIDTALANAHGNLPTNGGDIIFPPGSYKLTAEPGFTKRVRMLGMGSPDVTAGGTGSTVIIKDAAMTTALIQFTVVSSGIENIEVEGEGGNTGDGIVLAAGRCFLKNVAAYSMGNDGIRIGTNAGTNANLWYLENIKSKSNGQHGVHVHDGSTNANAGTFLQGDLQSNTGNGLHVDNADLNAFINITPQTNTGYGMRFTSNSTNNRIFGGDQDETNTAGNILEEGTGNMYFGVSDGGFTDNGTATGRFTRLQTKTAKLLVGDVVAGATSSEVLDVRKSASGGIDLVGQWYSLGNAGANRGLKHSWLLPLSSSAVEGAVEIFAREGSNESTYYALQLKRQGVAIREVFRLTSLGGIQGLQTTNGPVGTFTMDADASTTVSNASVTTNSIILLFPTNAAAGTLMGSTECPYIASKSAGTSFTVGTADGGDAAGTETFNYVILN